MLEGSILQKLHTAHQNTDHPLTLGVYYKNTLVALCHALEDFILDSKSEPLVITAFQQGKWYMEEADRYGDLAGKARKIAIMASPGAGFEEHPTSQRDNVDLVSLDPDSDPVAQEWHLMICSPSYTAMVLCQELSDADYGKTGQPEHDLERKFYGFWTFEPDLVLETVEIAIAHIAKYNPSLSAELEQQFLNITSAFGTVEKEDTGVVVSQVVDYLQNSQAELLNRQQASADREASYLPQAQNLDDNLLSNEMQAFLRMAQLIDQADINNPMAASEVAALAETMGQVLDLPAWQQKRLRLASLLHRLVPSLGATPKPEEHPKEVLSCELIPSIEALRAMPRMSAIARIITHQREHWDGTGIPGQLAHDDIPLESRIIALTSYFQYRVNDLRMQGKTDTREATLNQAYEECKERANTIFDPKLVEALGLLVMGLQQGMSLETAQPKISAGMWLLDNEQLIS
ncbi:putative sensor protein [Halothece sp. PCC 7418]|uniref:DICT sensory domain-containing protein n=1 Tax=Halothece sp. (strain PCC 7418) TaxID=65093 RepID=UPI0002A06775|nr:DICT sensory domain-containing protein [Halothece sp. PCC 7418]AFZ45659.1 putative sensor protein [Halothece sp. PCC 7418]